MIGLNHLLSLSLGLSLAGIFNKLGLPSGQVSALWKMSLLRSVAAREYARRFAPEVVEEAALGGLILDIALPVMYAADQSAWPALVGSLDLAHESRMEEEKLLYGADHGRFGHMLAKRLGLPEMYQFAIRVHHGGVAIERAVTSLGLARSLQFAAALPHRPADSPQLSAVRLRQWMPPCATAQQEEIHIATLLETISGEYAGVLAMLGHDDANVAFTQFLQELTIEAARHLGSAIGESVAEISALKSRESAMEDYIRTLETRALSA